MKSIIRKGLASLMTLFAAVAFATTASAEVKLYIPDFTVNNYAPVTVNVMLDNSEPVLAYSFNIELPGNLEFVGGIEKTDRFNQGQTVALRNNTVGCFSMQNYTFLGNSGSVGTFQVRAKSGSLSTVAKNEKIVLKNLTVVCEEKTTQGENKTVFIPEQATAVTLAKPTVPVHVSLSAQPQDFLINPNGVQEITVAMDNSDDVQAMQFNVTLPDGFTFVTENGNIFQQLPRLGSGATIMPRTNGNLTRVVIADMVNNLILESGSGDFMRFKIKAPEGFTAETAQIVISDIQATVGFQTVKDIDPVNVTISNGFTAYNKANGEIAGLRQALTDALTTIANEAADVKDQFPGTEIDTRINDLAQAVEAAYADMTLTGNYDTIMAPVAEIKDAIAQLVADAKAAQKAHDDEVAAEAARQEAYKNANALVAGLETKLTETLSTIAKDAPDVKDQFQGEAIKASIDALKQNIEKAYEDKTIVPDYDKIVAPAPSIEEAMARLIEEANAAQKAYTDNANLEAANQKATAELAALDKALSDALVTIATECPDVKQLFPGTEILQQIGILREAVKKAYADKTLFNDYDNVMAPVATINDAIAKLIENAKAAQKKHDDEVAAEQALKEALKNANGVVAELETKLNEALSTIATECPDVKGEFTGDAVKTSINDLKKAIYKAYADKTLTADYDNVVAPAASIEAAMAKLVEDAKAAQKKHDDELAAAEAARQEAYKNANGVVAGLESKLAETLSTIATECPDVKDNFKGEAVSASIVSMKKDIDKAFEDKTIVANYDKLVAPAASIEAAMAKLIEDAKASQKAFEENARLETARTNANNELSALDKALADALSTIATECPDVKNLFPGSDIQQQITVLRNAVNKAYSDKTLADKYDEVMAPAANINTAIATLIEDAKAAQKKFEEDAAAEKALVAAYNNANGLIEGLQKKLAETLSTIATECPDVNDQFKGDAVKASINDLKKAVDKAYADKTLATDYNNVVAPAASIEAAMAKLVEDAKAAQKKHDDEVAADKALAEARTNANNELSALDKALADALSTIAKECPDVKHLFPGTDVQQQITVLRNAVNKAYEEKTLADKYKEVMAPVADINAAITKLVADAKAAQKKFEDDAAAEKALLEAYKNANAAVDGLKTKLAEALATIAGTCPDVKDNYTGEAIEKNIASLKESVKDAYEMKTLADDYQKVMAPAAGIEEAIAKLVADAQAAQKKIDDEKAAALKEANDKANAAIDGLKTKLADALATIAETCPDVKDDFKGEAVSESIDALKAAVDKAYEDKTLTDDYDKVMEPVAGIEESIAALVDAAKEAQKKFEENAALQEAYKNANARIDALKESLAEAFATIAETCPNVKDQYKGEAVSESIDALKAAVDKAYEEKTLTDDYDNVMAPAESIEKSISDLVDAAKAAQKAYEEAEAARKAANKAAYEADLATIAKLQADLDKAKADIEAQYPGYDFKAECTVIQDAIDSEKAKADNEYALVADEGEYVNEVDAEGINAMIAEMIENAKNTGIEVIFGEEIVEGDRIFTIDGREVPCLQHGKINVIVKADGRVIKAYVK